MTQPPGASEGVPPRDAGASPWSRASGGRGIEGSPTESSWTSSSTAPLQPPSTVAPSRASWAPPASDLAPTPHPAPVVANNGAPLADRSTTGLWTAPGSTAVSNDPSPVRGTWPTATPSPTAAPTWGTVPVRSPQQPLAAPGQPGQVPSLTQHLGASTPRPARRPAAATFALTTYKPGIVALRPLTLGDVLGAAFRLLRFNLVGTVGLTLIVAGVGAAASVPLALLVNRLVPSSGLDSLAPTAMLQLLSVSIPTIIGAFLLTPMLSFSTQQAVIGNKATITELWSLSRPRLLPYFGTAVLVGLALSAPTLVVTALAVLALYQGSFAVAALLGLALLVTSLATLALGAKLLPASPLSVLENNRPVAAIKRSWALTRGSFWRILGIYLLATIISSTITQTLASALSLPLMIIGLGTFSSDPNSSFTLAPLLLTAAAQGGATLFQAPFLTAIVTLLTLDLKMRHEGYDLDLMEQANQHVTGQTMAVR